MARKRRDDVTVVASEDYFAQYAKAYPPVEEEKKAEPKAKEPTTAELLAKIGTLETEVSSLRTRPAPAVTVRAPTVQAEQPKLDLSNMPDPTLDRAAYDAELARRQTAFTQATVQHAEQRVLTVQEQRSAADRLWSGFKEQHPEWAKHDKLVNMVGEQVALATGLQPNSPEMMQYVLGNTPQFYTDLAKALDRDYGALKAAKPGAKTEDPVDDNEDDDDNEGRTAGIAGGNESGDRPVKGGAPLKDGGLADDMRAMQKRMGIY